ncbi:uncharacterized protein TRIADDRAFT_52637 [Trichoplax adhaerens]|uniref:Uncharacterized protein n=1 Tax=Trichoplax adhaerens TaxID=10228 RepID=B3RJI4_TRIAD|nr:hypothetical protein TRIADDRAFT_52637 [Trichoplax adhaerens]EDV29102.1 hypothetical protein TRIADDRAFT_52637 [Trichoplax adhaerens]|eukprot:XP_002108304.1 hypothetical protein TRIADDRAFT_52637 [Trichoplax adhaerens]
MAVGEIVVVHQRLIRQSVTAIPKEKKKKKKLKKDKKSKKHSESKSSGPVQLSQYLQERKKDEDQRSAVSGKKMKLKIKKSTEDKQREKNRQELLNFLNSQFG